MCAGTTTSAKNPITDDLYRGMIPATSMAEYARVHKMTIANEVSGQLRMRPGQPNIVLDFVLSDDGLTITQDGTLIASKKLEKPLHLPSGPLRVSGCKGIYGACPPGVKVSAKLL